MVRIGVWEFRRERCDGRLVGGWRSGSRIPRSNVSRTNSNQTKSPYVRGGVVPGAAFLGHSVGALPKTVFAMS